MTALRLLESSLYVDDLARAGRFYRDVLALTPMLEDRRMIAFDCGDARVLLLFERGAARQPLHLPGGDIPAHDGSGPLHVAFGVAADDLAGWEARLPACGVAIEARMTWPRGGQSLYFRDPDGHLLEIATPGLWPNY